MGVQRPPLETLWVDMGLPSGNRWAVSNLDATGPYFFQESPFQYECSFFSWGNITPHNPNEDDSFDYDFTADYPSTTGAALVGSIPIEHDAARQLLGGPWRIPSMEEYSELLSYCDIIDAEGNVIPRDVGPYVIVVNGYAGVMLRSQINGTKLFFAAVGNAPSRSLVYKAERANGWSTTAINATQARSFYYRDDLIIVTRTVQRSAGCFIRPIWNPRDLRG